ncbi:TlpA family protein disulfide reductase [Spongiimicrobium salis]|uniref:TlpA family protein disulfide reductase n=1 Tax=Spongiimicrobium salis TaxID=1667022 RepID=UPI00374C9850
MKKTTKQKLGNVLFLVAIALILFTPVGFHLRVFTSKLISYTPFATPAELDSEEQTRLASYQWSLLNTDGQALNLSAEEGKVVFINFWATWCPPCVAEMPDLQELYNAYGDKVSFLFVANDEVDRVNTFMKKKEYSFPVWFSKSNTPIGLEHPTIPTTYLIDKSGNIVLKETMVADWNSEEFKKILDRLLKE